MKTLLVCTSLMAAGMLALSVLQPTPPPRFNLVVAAGSDPSALRLEYPEARRVEVDAQGDLALHVGSRSIKVPRPDAYQEAGGERRAVPVQFSLDHSGYVTFAFGRYDGHLPLVVVPFHSQAGLR